MHFIFVVNLAMEYSEAFYSVHRLKKAALGRQDYTRVLQELFPDVKVFNGLSVYHVFQLNLSLVLLAPATFSMMTKCVTIVTYTTDMN